MRRENMHVWHSVIDDSIAYSVGLRDENGMLLLQHRRHTFVKGMIIAAKSARNLALDLLYQQESPYSFVLNYKWSQDHIELLNSSIRGRNGNNNNPNVPQFKVSLKKILLHAAISSSRYANCMSFDQDDSPPIFSLKWAKNRSAITEKESTTEIEVLPYLEALDDVSEIKKNALAYIGGCIVRSLANIITCEDCCLAMLSSDKTKRNIPDL